MSHIRIHLSIIFIMVLSLALCSCSRQDPPKVNAGVLDLTGRGFKDDTPIKLDGQWEFYWQELLSPHDFPDPSLEARADYIQVPGPWNGHMVKGEAITGQGYATYHLTILLPNHSECLAFKMMDIMSAYALYVNGEKVSANGVVGTSRDAMVPYFYYQAAGFVPNADRLDIVLQVSNFHHHRGGVCEVIKFGPEAQIKHLWERNVATQMFLFGSILIIGLYHLGLFMLRKNDRSPLYFGIYCLLVAGFTLTNGERYLTHIFPDTSWYLLYQILFHSFFLCVPAFALFVYSLFPKETNRYLLYVIVATGGLFSIFAIFTPTGLSTASLSIYQLVTVVVCLYILLILFMAAARRREGARIFLFGFIILFLSAFNDILQNFGLIDSFFMIPLGLFIFILSQAYLLSRRFSLAFLAEEQLSRELNGKSMELEHTRNYLSNVFNSLSSMLVSVTPEGIITQWNTATERHTGIQASDAIDTGVWGALPFFKPYMDVLNTVVQTGKPVDLPRQKVSAFEERYLSISIAPLTYDQTSGAVILIDDVTEMAMKDAQLIQAQKMETVGNLAGGLAHDFNNVLGGIIGTISLMRYSDAHKSMNSEKFSSRIDLIERSANRAVDLVQQLLALSKKQELSLAPVDLNLSTKHVLKICQNTFDKSIVIEAEYFPEPAVIMADPAQVEQVLLNLCVNASHAMTIMRGGQEEPGGTLSLTIKRIHADHYFCSTHPEAKTGHYWVLNVRDTGVGMEARTIAKIFDPFFTTKEIGTGLGLAMVSNIIQQHDGFLDIYSEFGSGTSFNLFFPEQEGVTAGAEVVKTDEFLHLGSGTILVVEDDEIIRKTASTMLEECGYEVITATDGKAAVFVFEKRHHEIKGVLMDMAMPRMSGKEAYIRMKKIAPGIKVLLTSGFKQDQRVQDVFEMGVDGFIQKPYSMPDLIKKVREVFE